MIRPEPIESIIPRIVRQYEEEPRGWHVLSTPSGDWLVLGPHEAYQLRLVPLDPMRYVGSGTAIDDVDRVLEATRSAPEFGLRPLNDSDLRRLMAAAEGAVALSSSVESVLGRAPRRPTAVFSSDVRHVLSGPVLVRPDLRSMSPAFSEVQEQLDRAAVDMFRTRFPERARMFF